MPVIEVGTQNETDTPQIFSIMMRVASMQGLARRAQERLEVAEPLSLSLVTCTLLHLTLYLPL